VFVEIPSSDSEESSEDDFATKSPDKKPKAKKPKRTGILSQIQQLIATAPTKKAIQVESKTEPPKPEPSKPTTAKQPITDVITDQAKMKAMSRDRLHQQRKLMLFLDIDHTIVHSSKDPQAKRFLKHPTLGPSVVELNFKNQHGCPYFVIMRPGLTQFLREVIKKYNVVLYTMGSRAYAECVCKVIDPKSTLIRNRIISREDRYDKNLVDERDRPIKSIQEFFPLYRSTAMIVDDTCNVWSHPEDVYRVAKFLFWGTDTAGDSNEHTSIDWNPNRMVAVFNADRELYRALNDLNRVYSRYFDQLDAGGTPSAPELMRSIYR